jgi:cytochrome c-type biogenesis protein CcmH
VSARTGAWVVLAVVVAVVLAIVLWPSGGEPTTSERVSALASELRCPDCEGQSIQQSSTATARAARADIRRRVEAGESDADIRQAFVDKFGDSILLKPEQGGIGLLVWGLPVLAVLLGAGGLVLALRRWQREPHLHATAADERLVAQERDREAAE